MVSAWATANHISLTQVTVDEKSNEITVIGSSYHVERGSPTSSHWQATLNCG